MATLDSSPSQFTGQPWSTWVETIGGGITDDEEADKEDDEEKKDICETLKLRKEDKWLYGVCPAQDEFFLAVCESCGQVVKPQALRQHIDCRHGGVSCSMEDSSSRSHPSRGTKSSHFPPSRKLNAINDRRLARNLPHSLPVVNLTRISSTVSMTQPNLPGSAAKSSAKAGSVRAESAVSDSWADHKKSSHSSSSPQVKAQGTPPALPSPERQEKGPPPPPLITQTDNDGSKSQHRKMKEVILAIPDNDEDYSPFPRIIISPEPGGGGSQGLMRMETLANNSGVAVTQEAGNSPVHVVVTTLNTAPILTHVTTSSPHHNSQEASLAVAAITKSTYSMPTVDKMTATAAKQAPLLAPKVMQGSAQSISGKSTSMTLTTAVSTTASIATPVTTAVSSSKSLSSITNSSHSKLLSSGSKKKSPKGPKDEKFIPCALREYDADRHCGVWRPELDKHCTRSLTCKTHALSLRRAVQGRTKPFDQLLKDHKDAKDMKLKIKSGGIFSGSESTDINSSSSSISMSSPSPLPMISTPSLLAPLSSKPPDIILASPPIRSTTNSNHCTASVMLSPTSSEQPSVHVAGLQSPPSSRLLSPPPSSSRSSLHTISATPSPWTLMSRGATSKLIVSPLLHRPSLLPAFPSSDRLVPMELGETSSGDEEEDDNIPLIPHHPRPLAVNNFGSWLHGRGCYVFNRREDLYRAACAAAVERHLHPPPHKRLCVESKLPKGSVVPSGVSSDPYEFAIGSADNGHHQHHKHYHHKSNSAAVSKNASILGNVSKPSSKNSGSSSTSHLISASSSHANSSSSNKKTSSGATKTSSSSKQHSSSTSSASSSTAHGSHSSKRKRSSGPSLGSSANMTSTATLSGYTPSPISIAIPTCSINVNLSSQPLGTLGGSVGLAHKSSMGQSAATNSLKDVNIVVSSLDPSLVNGQLLSIAGGGANHSQQTHIQLNNLAATARSKSCHSGSKLSAKKVHPSLSGTSRQSTGIGSFVSTFSAAPGTVLIAPTSVGMVTHGSMNVSNGSSTVISARDSSPSPPLLHLGSDSASPASSAPSPLSNGLLTSPHAFINKSYSSTSDEITAISIPSPTSVDFSLMQQSGIGLSLGHNLGVSPSNRHMKKARATTDLPLSVSNAQQLAAAALNLHNSPLTTPSGGSPDRRSSAGLQLYSGTMLNTSTKPFSSLQFQPKTGGSGSKGGNSSKVSSIQPMLTIVSPSAGVGASQSQQRLLLRNEDRHKRDLSQHNSPSNVFS